jgi:hypothetical protein
MAAGDHGAVNSKRQRLTCYLPNQAEITSASGTKAIKMRSSQRHKRVGGVRLDEVVRHQAAFDPDDHRHQQRHPRAVPKVLAQQQPRQGQRQQAQPDQHRDWDRNRDRAQEGVHGSGQDVKQLKNNQPDDVGGMPVARQRDQPVMLLGGIGIRLHARQHPEHAQNAPAGVDQVVERGVVIDREEGAAGAVDGMRHIPADFIKLHQRVTQRGDDGSDHPAL